MERQKYIPVSPAASRADHYMFGIGRVGEGNIFLTLSALLSCISLLCHTLLLVLTHYCLCRHACTVVCVYS